MLYHYTNELAFCNVANMEQTTAELFALMVDSRAHFGKGVYCSQHEPAVLGQNTVQCATLPSNLLYRTAWIASYVRYIPLLFSRCVALLPRPLRLPALLHACAVGKHRHSRRQVAVKSPAARYGAPALVFC